MHCREASQPSAPAGSHSFPTVANGGGSLTSAGRNEDVCLKYQRSHHCFLPFQLLVTTSPCHLSLAARYANDFISEYKTFLSGFHSKSRRRLE
ncbi:hypothetical protein CesoFtcFv8_009804 [Champsocephalus esox]|uniref:Uncharacterized protein n=1 Tax=Champsocephalus esox TaxID=159716 RepID=A0AAN8C3Y2_9TELE|nr:hypothetical protein CesoFtcFv8_009804 [Champsocephalus esox]